MSERQTSSLHGQVAMITGASQGIGQAIARQLAPLGIHLVLCARNVQKLTELSRELALAHPEVQTLPLACDVRDAAQVEQAVTEAQKTFGKINILINNAGVAAKIGLLQEISVEEIDRTIDTNLKGSIYCMRAVLPMMVQQNGGVILNINSIAGKTAYPFWSVYDASKFGLHAITEAVAEEQRGNNIKVIGIYPGAVDTAIWEGLHAEEGPRKEGMLAPDQVAEAVVYILNQPQNVFIKDLTITPLKPLV
ncbi:SDR family oxidoreductase [Vampirovibrio sp.]|uniref:SDR family oxidoreductase n=1 Tax=Vampirovibrio sp. TaxID=2717857 RepID=UPI0035948B2B